MSNEKVIDMRLIGFTSVALIMGMGLALAVGVSASKPGVGAGDRVGMQNHDEVEAILEAGDYEAFLELRGDTRRNGAQLTEEQFDEMVERHNEREAERDAYEKALAGGYDTWFAYVEGQPTITDYVTEENFDRYVDMHEAMQSGDRETALEIREELGIPQGFRNGGVGHGNGMGMGAGKMHKGGAGYGTGARNGVSE